MPFDHRVDRFEEAIRLIRSLLRERHVNFTGTYYQARDCELRPPGPRPHGPPIMVGPSGPRMLSLTARFADSWNADFGSSPESIRSFDNTVDAACQKVRRDPTALERSAGVFVDAAGHARPGDHGVADVRAERALSGSAEELATALRAHAEAGIGTFRYGWTRALWPELRHSPRCSRCSTVQIEGRLRRDTNDQLVLPGSETRSCPCRDATSIQVGRCSTNERITSSVASIQTRRLPS